MAIVQQKYLRLNNMAISKGAIESALKSQVSFDRSSSHFKGDLMLSAIAAGVFTVFTSSATIIVNTGGGGDYFITGVSASALDSAIKSNLPLTLTGKYAKGGAMAEAAASGIAKAISLAVVSVPAETVGIFPVKNFDSGVIRAEIRAKLSQNGFDLTNPYSRASEMIDAIAGGVSGVILASAQYAANGVTGGAFVMM